MYFMLFVCIHIIVMIVNAMEKNSEEQGRSYSVLGINIIS